ncbi:MAG TPA: hypothetical protein EYH03_01600 [Chromatiales bacterium]|nr:hypothetical protein [Chromatiales bacterium]
MTYLMIQILTFLLLAALLGLLIGWWLARRGLEERLVKSDQQWRQRLQLLETENQDLRGRLSPKGRGGRSEAGGSPGGETDLAHENRQLKEQVDELENALADAQSLNQSRGRRINELEARLVEVEKHMVNATGSGDQLKRLIADKQELELRNQQCIAELNAAKTKLAECEVQKGEMRGTVKEVADSVAAKAPPEEPIPAIREEVRPQFLSAPEGEPDDLKKIKGVGPKLEATLNELGIYHFHQIAGFTRDQIAWVDGFLSFKGRIDREKWVQQAKSLAAAASKEGSGNAD